MDDDEAWARARAALARLPVESPEQRAERLRRQRWLDVMAVVLTGLAVVVLVLALVLDGGIGEREDVPAWRQAAGAVVMVAGFVLMIVAIVSYSGAVRHLRWRNRPLDWLTRGERRQLLRQARGQEPLLEERLLLVRHVAEVHLIGGATPAQPAALVLAWSGFLLASPGPLPFLLVLFGTVSGAAGVTYQRWDSARLRRFLEEEPAP